MTSWIVILFSILLTACSTSEKPKEEVTESDEITPVSKVKDSYLIEVKELNDDDYPDNPDIGYRDEQYGEYSHNQLILSKNNDGTYKFLFSTGNELSEIIEFPSLDIKNFMPEVPEWIKQDEYLTFITMINQEWNREQVRFDKEQGYFTISKEHISGSEYDDVTRIDIARNCLNSGLWEIIAWKKDSTENSKVYYHGWFDFPLDLYEELFNEVNTGLEFSKFKDYLVDWRTPARKEVKLNLLRKKGDEIKITAESLNDKLYPETGARKTKKKNIIYPTKFDKIQDFLTDRTTFSTFTPPGTYSRLHPRHTTLGMLAMPHEYHLHHVENKESGKSNLKEFELKFFNEEEDMETKLVFGGINLDSIPTLTLEESHKGAKFPMGIANHSFYENYDVNKSNKVSENPYYGLILDDEGKWIDSHFLGIDGPLFFWDKEEEGVLHLFLLAFERHSYVGHFIFKIEE